MAFIAPTVTKCPISQHMFILGILKYEAVTNSVEKPKNMGKFSFMPLLRLYSLQNFS
jgi:hypothetical protein